MLDLTPRIEQQRSRGRALAAFALRDGQTRLADLHQSGSAKVILPRVSGTVPEAVFLNTSGGLTGGDSLDLRLEVGPGCRVLATTQTAERAYQAQGPARVSVTAQVGAGGRLDWLPQETLLYQHSHLLRRTEIDLAPDAGCLMAETIILGRLAMGEVTRTAHLTDHRRVTRLGRPVWAARSGPPGLGRPVWADSLHLTPEVLQSGNPALLDGSRALAVVCLIAQGAEDAVGPVRAVLERGAASGWEGRCVVRMTAPDGWTLKRELARVLHILSGRPLPRVWASGGVP